MTLLFIRKAFVKVGKSGESTGLQFNTRVTFEIEKTLESTSNKGKIGIYNLNQDSQSFLEQNDLQVELYAGYEEQVEQLFIGDIKRVNRTRSGPDIIASIECGDGEKKIEESTYTGSFAPGSTNIQVLNAAIKALGVTIGTVQDLKSDVFQGGFVFAGQVKKLLNQLTKDQKLQWSIQDGELIIIGKGKVTAEEGPLITSETGMIGFPSKTEKGIQFKSLLNPKIRPGRMVQIKTLQYAEAQDAGPTNPKILLNKAASGNFKVTKVKHSGDSMTGNWTSEVEAILPESEL